MIFVKSTTDDPGLPITASFNLLRETSTSPDFQTYVSQDFNYSANFFETGSSSNQTYSRKSRGLNVFNQSFHRYTSSTATRILRTNLTGLTTSYGWTQITSRDDTPDVPGGSGSNTGDGDVFFSDGSTTRPITTTPIEQTCTSLSTYLEEDTTTNSYESSFINVSSTLINDETIFNTFNDTRVGTSLNKYNQISTTYYDWWDDTTITEIIDDYDNPIQKTVSSTYFTKSTVSSVTLDGFRTYNVFYPEYGKTLLSPILSSESFGSSLATILQSVNSWRAESVWDTYSYYSHPIGGSADNGTFEFPRQFVSTTFKTETSNFFSGTTTLTRQFRENLSGQYSTQTYTRFGGEIGENTINLATGLFTYNPTQWTTTTMARVTSSGIVVSNVVTGTLTSTMVASFKTHTNKSFLYGFSTITNRVFPQTYSNVPGHVQGTSKVTSNDLFYAITENFHWLNYSQKIGKVLENAAEIGKSQMGNTDDWGIGMTGIPNGWDRAGYAFDYSTVYREFGNIIFPIGSSIAFTGNTRYTGDVDLNTGFLTRLVTNFVESTHTTDSTSFVWENIETTFYQRYRTNIGHVNYINEGTYAFHGIAEVINSDGKNVESGNYSTAASSGERIFITHLAHIFARTGTPVPIEVGDNSPQQ